MSTAATSFSAAELVRGLTDEQREEVLFVLVREALALFPKSGTIPIRPDGEPPLCHLLTPLGVEELSAKFGAASLPQWEVPLHERPENRTRGLTIEEVWARIDAEETARDAQSRSRAAG